MRASWFVALIGLWLSEWLLQWSDALGPLTEPIAWLWLAGLVVLVVRSRIRTRLPAAVVVWAWMAALLAVAAFRAWWLARGGPLTDVVHAPEFFELLREFPAHTHTDFQRLAQLFDVLATPLAIGFTGGIVAAFEIAVVGLALAIARRLRDYPPPRVGLLARLAVVLLQIPTLLLVPALGHAMLAGTIAGLSPDFVTAAPPEATRTLAELRAHLGPILGLAIAGWALGAVHLRRLLALADGGRVTRLVLALFAALPAALVVAARPGVGPTIAVLLWAAVQLALLGLACRPRD